MSISSLQKASGHALGQLTAALNAIEADAYRTPLPVLSGGTIGRHVRHLVEFYQCLFEGLVIQQVNYDARARNPVLEQDKDLAGGILEYLMGRIAEVGADQPLTLLSSYHPDQTVAIPSSLYRELVYNLEHCIHHQATIRIGLEALHQPLPLGDGFGLAPSTLNYQQSNVHSHVSTLGQ